MIIKIKNLKYNFIYKSFSLKRNPLLKQYEIEKSEYDQKMKEYRKKHQKEFWEEQTKVENKYIEEFMTIQKQKKLKDDAKIRNRIIKNSMICYNNIKKMIDEQQAFLAKQKLWKEEDTDILMKKHDLLHMLDRQTENWLTPNNIDEKINIELNNIIPPVILSHVDYYNRINRYAVLVEQGLNEEAEQVRLNKKIIDYKNKQLAPLYLELKTIIKNFTYSEEYSVYELYNETVNRLKNNFEGLNQIDTIIEHFTILFKQLITLIRLEYENPSIKLNMIENQMKSLIMILVIWTKYTDIIYLPDIEIEKIFNKEIEKNKLDDLNFDELIENNDPVALKNYYFSKITEKKTRGKGLFLSDFKDFYDIPKYREKIKDNLDKLDGEEYESYDSDLDENELIKKKAEKIDKKTKGLLTSDAKKQESLTKGKLKITGDKKKLLETEVENVFEDKDQIGNKPIDYDENYSTVDNDIRDINSDSIKKEKKKDFLAQYMLMRTKEIMKEENFSRIDAKKEYEEFRKNLMNENGLSPETNEFEDIDKELDTVDLSKILDLNKYDEELNKEKERLTLEKEFRGTKLENLFESELFETLVQYSKDIYDFKKPKLTSNIDIYDENLIKYLEYSVEEAKIINKSNNTSIIMEFIKYEIDRIDNDFLNPSDRLKKKHLVRLANLCANTRIVDSQNLKQIFDMFKSKPITF